MTTTIELTDVVAWLERQASDKWFGRNEGRHCVIAQYVADVYGVAEPRYVSVGTHRTNVVTSERSSPVAGGALSHDGAVQRFITAWDRGVGETGTAEEAL